MSAMEIDFDELESREVDINDANAHPETARLLAELDRKTSARRLAVPTKDADVRARLRELGEPMTLFGERPEDRRDRLRQLWSALRQKEKDAKAAKGSDDDSETDSDDSSPEEKEEEFYTEGTMDLKAARRHIAEYSLPRCVHHSTKSVLVLITLAYRSRKRVARQRFETTVPLGRLIDVRRAVYDNLKTFTNLGSQIGDTRPLSSLRFSPDSSMLLTSSWTGHAKLWSLPHCKEIKTFKGASGWTDGEKQLVLTVARMTAHKERIGGVAWHPQGTLSQSRTAANFATSGADNDIKIWSLEG